MADLHDIPGIAELQELTLGDPGVHIALIDGLPDLDHEVFRGRTISVVDPSGLLQFEADHHPDMREHATFVGSILVGDPDGQRPGIAPDCSLTFVVAVHEYEDFDTRLSYVRALEAAYESGAPIVHSAIALPSQSGRVDPLVEKAAQRLRDAGVLLVSPTGNDHGTTWTFPAIADYCLAVGNADDSGNPVDSTNNGVLFEGHGVMANGTRILGAVPGGGFTRQRGTSLAAPHATGVAALLLSIAREHGIDVDPMTIGRAIIASATPCVKNPERCIGGVINPMGALRMLQEGATPDPSTPGSLRLTPEVNDESRLPPNSPVRYEAPDYPDEGSAMLDGPPRPEPETIDGAEQSTGFAGDQSAASLLPRTPKMAFVLGRIGYDIPDDTRRRVLVSALAAADVNGSPEDPAALSAALAEAPWVAQEVTWLVLRDSSPLYAVVVTGSFANELLAAFAAGVGEQVSGGIEEMSFPGLVTGDTTTLSTDEVVPVLRIADVRGLYGWRRQDQIDRLALTPAGREQLGRILAYIDDGVPNDGTHSHVRAINYLVTNPAQLAWSAAIVGAEGFQFDNLTVRRSTLNRPYSDCWDIDLIFKDPDHSARARLLHRHTVDVGDPLPVSIGRPRTWSLS